MTFQSAFAQDEQRTALDGESVFAHGAANRPYAVTMAKQRGEREMGNRVGRFMLFLVVLVGLSVWGVVAALSQTLSLDDQSAMEVGEEVTFTISLDNPSGGQDIASMTIDVNFDSMVLTYDSHTVGSLVAAWSFFDVNSPESGLLKIAGFNLQGIPPGSSGAVVELHFTVAGMDNATLTMESSDGFATQSGEFTFELPPANNPPVASDDMGTTVQDQSVMIDVLANDHDADGNSLTITAITQGANGTVAIAANGATVTYTPNAGFTGSDEFIYTVSDGTDDATAMVVVTVTAPPPPANNPPVATDDEAETDEGESVMISVLANDTDTDGDSLTVTDATDGNSGTVEVATDGAAVTYTPNADFAGEDEFMYTVSDGEGGMDTATVLVAVNEVAVMEVDNGGGGGGGGCTLNPGARFDPTLVSVLFLLMGVHIVRRFTRGQSLN